MLTRWTDFDRLFGWPDERRSLDSLLRLNRQINRLFNEPSTTARSGVVAAGPRTNLYDTGEELVVTAEIPGMTADDIEVTVHNDTLTLGGTRKVEPPEGYSAHRRERWPIEFKRSFTLPCKVDMEKASAAVNHGILTVHLAKAPESQPRQITVQAK